MSKSTQEIETGRGDQLEVLPESKGADKAKARPQTQRPETPPATVYDGGQNPEPREDAPGTFRPQDDTPSILEKRDGGKVRSSGQ